MRSARSVTIFAMLLVAPFGLALGQPLLTLDPTPAQVRPSDTTTISIGYRGEGTVVSVAAQVVFDTDLFSSVIVRCLSTTTAEVLVTCNRNRDDALELRIRSLDGATPLPTLAAAAELVMTVAPTAPAGLTVLSVENETYLDAAGVPVTSPGSADAEVEVLVIERQSFISRSFGVRGDALLFPYFTGLGERETLFVLKNESPVAKAVRLNIREGATGRTLVNEVVGTQLAQALNVYLKAGEMVRFRIATNPATGISFLQTGACTLPAVPPGGIPLAEPLLGKGEVVGPPLLSPAGEEGFMTALVMADLGNIAAALLNQGGCDTVIQGFTPSGPWATDPTNGTVEPAGNIAGVYTVRGLEGRVSYEGGAVALRGFSAGNGHRAPWEDFTLNDGQAAARVFPLVLNYNSGAEAVSAVLMKEDQRLQVRSQGVEWLFSSPTKRFFTDQESAIGTVPLPPFNEAFDPVTGSCDPVVIAPLGLNVRDDFCFSVNAVPFDGRSLLESKYAIAAIGSTTDTRTRIQFSGTGLTDNGAQRVLDGLPVIGDAIPYRAGVTRRVAGIAGVVAAEPVPIDEKSAKGDDEADEAGASVSIAGRLVFVGAPGANDGRGAVFVFRRHGTVLVPEATLEVPPEYDVAEFGASLAADGEQVIVGSPGDVSQLGKGDLPSMQASVWSRLNATWSLKTPVTADDTGGDSDDGWGTAVAIEGDVFAVGGPGDDSMGPDAGAVFLFDGDAFTTVQPTDPTQMGAFGASMAIKQGVMGVGSPIAAVANQTAGSVSMYGQIATNLSQIGVLTDVDPDDGEAFGAAISFTGSSLAIGAPGTDGGEFGEVDGQGEVQLWEFDGEGFNAFASFTADDAGLNGGFGSDLQLAADGSFIVVGAPGALGTFGEGAYYEFSEVDEEFLMDDKTSPDEDAIEGFGSSVATDGEVIIVGAPETAQEAGAALVVVDAEVLFFDDMESKLLR